MIPERHRTELARLESGYWWYQGRVEWAERLIRAWVPNGHIAAYADIGCGTGGFAREMLSRFSVDRAALVDAEPPTAEGFVAKRVEVLRADLSRELPLGFSPDVITLMDVLEHMDDDAALLRRLHAALRPGGLFVMSVPAHQWLFSDWDKHLGHRRRYGARQLARVVASAGFRVRALRGMWSFCLPAGPVRKFSARKQESLEFPPVSPALNRLLVSLSRAEYRWGKILPPQLGTSLLLSATKENP